MTSKARPDTTIALGTALTIFSAVSFGLYPAATRAIYADGGNASFVILAATFARAISLSLFCVVTGKKFLSTREDIRLGATGGLFQALSSLGIISALVYLPGPVMIIILFSHTLMLLVYMALKKEITADVPTVITTLSALLGLSFVLNLWSIDLTYSLIGISLALVGAIATASRVYVYGKQTTTKNPAVVGAENFLMAALFVCPIVFFSLPALPSTMEGYFYTVAACLSLIAGTFAMFYGISMIGAFRFSLFLKLEPVFTTIFSILIVNEVLQWQQYAGIALVIGSLVTYQTYDKIKKSKCLAS